MGTTKQNSSLLYLIMLLGFVLGFLYNSRLDPTAGVPPVDGRHQLTSLRGLESARIDTSFLSSEQFKELRIFGSLPVQPVGNGKSDPFH
ncbi:MAG: hypothetical protein IT406_01835 [Candidatus Yanofskybacteria bacterium]|nr:hypothetical protein [Candidatus Yanofskybacteria bacterium]